MVWRLGAVLINLLNETIMTVLSFSINPVSGWPVVGFPQWLRSDVVSSLQPPDLKRAEDEFRLLRTKVFVPGYEVTPALAAVMLGTNDHNRWCAKGRCEEMAGHMKAGAWPVTGEPLIFAEDGTLNDGQHRLVSCMLSGRSFKTDIRFGIERTAFAFTGVGARRTAADVLHIAGFGNAKTFAGSLRLLHCWMGKDYQFRDHLHPGDTQRLAKLYPDLPASVKLADDWKRRTLPMQTALAGFLHYILSRDPKGTPDNERYAAATEFFERLSTGLNLSDQTDPIFLLRERLIKEKSRFNRPPERQMVVRFTLKAWNLHRSGKRVQKLVLMDREPYPFPK